MTKDTNQVAQFIKKKRQELELTQEQFALRVGVGLRFIRDLEQGKLNLNMSKVLTVLNFLGAHLEAISNDSSSTQRSRT